MSTWVISDVHGCGLELQELLGIIKGCISNAKIYAVGDLFDRAPYPELVWQLIHDYDIQCVMGNHEKKLYDFLIGKRDNVPLHYHYAINKLVKIIDRDQLINFLENLPITRTINTNKRKWILAHAGVNPHDPYDEDLSANVYGFWKPKPWFNLYNCLEHYDQPGVVYGHIACGEYPKIISHDAVVSSVGIDTSCCRGGWLTAYCLETNRWLRVKSPKDYFSELRQIQKKKIPHPKNLPPEPEERYIGC